MSDNQQQQGAQNPLQQQIEDLKKQVITLERDKNIFRKQLEKYEPPYKYNKQNPEKIKRLFETHIKKRYALKLAYIGINYQGIEFQNTGNNQTIEYHLFNAFKKTCIVENIEDMNLVNYSRSGRTDKGVSALGNVVALDLRTSIKKEDDQQNEQKNQLDYVSMLNSCLPKEIRILAAKEVHTEFNARHDCSYRVYKYFFVQGDLNIEKLEEAARLLIGEHDFRNFCKIDVLQTTNYIRKILDINVEQINQDSMNPKLNMFCITIKGTAFLWHMIRCIMCVLFRVGEGNEEPQVVNQLFDIEKLPGRPVYEFAQDLPLILYDCVYGKCEFEYEQTHVHKLYEHYKQTLQDKLIENQLYQTTMQFILQQPYYYDHDRNKIQNSNEKNYIEKYIDLQEKKQFNNKKYQKFQDRPVCDTPDQQISKLKGKRLDNYNNKLERTEKKIKLNNEQVNDNQ